MKKIFTVIAIFIVLLSILLVILFKDRNLDTSVNNIQSSVEDGVVPEIKEESNSYELDEVISEFDDDNDLSESNIDAFENQVDLENKFDLSEENKKINEQEPISILQDTGKDPDETPVIWD